VIAAPFAVLAGSVVAVGVALAVARVALANPPERLQRANYRGATVPVVLGLALAAASVVAVPVVAVWASAWSHPAIEESIPVGWAAVLMGAAGLWDDLRGDERPRGFRGHLGALRRFAVTGGIVKMAAAAITGLAAAAFLPARGAAPAAHVVEVVALVGLSANLVNLLDRAPGRAAKVALLAAVPLLILGDQGWASVAAPVFAATCVAMFFDLRERGMLGDAGANPLGAVLGVGLAASLDEPARLIAIVVLLALNLASEKWSFSRVIDATPPLRWFDRLGRKDQLAPK